MKRITLNEIRLTNFRGAKEQKASFSEFISEVRGANGTGKSRLMDSFSWCLYGKDKFDRKDYNIQSRDEEGNTTPKVDVEVEVVLAIDGTEYTFSRKYIEKWTRKRGQKNEELTGHNTICMVNGVPYNIGEYDKKVAELVGNDVSVKMLTNPLYFCQNIPWKDQRDILFKMAGALSDEEIAARDKECADMLDRLSGKTLAEYKREVVATKNKVKAELAETQPRIDQTHKLMPEAEDWDMLQKEIDWASNEIDAIDQRLQSKAAALDQAFQAELATRAKINELRTERDNIKFEAARAAKKRKDEEDAKREDSLRLIDRESLKISAMKTKLQSLEDDIKRTQDTINEQTEELDRLRDEYMAIRSREYTGDFVCPVCGQPLPEDKVAEALAAFDKEVESQLKWNNTRGKALSAKKKETEAALQELIRMAEEHKSEIESREAETKALVPYEPKYEVVDVTATPRWNEIEASIARLEDSLRKGEIPEDTEANQLKAEKADLKQKLNEAEKRMGKKGEIEKCQKEIEVLEKKARELAEELARLEGMEYTIARFTRMKIEDCESRINSLFQRVKFSMYRQTLDGNPEEQCVALVDGVPFDTANTASKLNAGLDIINGLCIYYDKNLPIFIDNAEGVNNIDPTYGQQIQLIVDKDEKVILILNK